MSGLLDWARTTWPVRLANGLLSAAMLPGDVYSGRTPITDQNGNISQDVINRSADLAGMVGGTSFLAPAERNAVGMGIRAYHGSPYDFDAFDASKIGTGEGAQAYGHGLYFAENPQVATEYRNQSGHFVYVNGQYLGKTGELPTATAEAAYGLAQGRSANAIEQAAQYRGPVVAKRIGDKARELIDQNADIQLKPAGRMYEVNINAEPQQFLDWDKPLSEQPPQVQSALTNSDMAKRLAAADKFGYSPADFNSLSPERQNYLISQTGPRNLVSEDQPYGSLERIFGSPAGVSSGLNQAGIPGIRYLDQGSRGPSTIYNVGSPQAGFGPYSPYTSLADAQKQLELLKGRGFSDAEIRTQQQPQTSNYVVFDPRIVDIVRKYGITGLLGAGAAGLPNKQQMSQ